MIIDLTGKNAIVTGSTSGIGFAIAKGLAGAGAAVTITGRTQEAVDRATVAINDGLPAPLASGLAADLTTPEGADALFQAVPETDILVNNLGIYTPKPLFEITDADWEHMLGVNVVSVARISRHYAPGMKARGWGRLIFISSESAQNIPVEMVHYGASKAAIQALSRGYAKELAGSCVTANAVQPGPTMTDNVRKFLADLAASKGTSPEEAEANFITDNRPSSLLGRFAAPEEVANICVYLASPLSSATTGSVLRAEGGIVEGIG